MFATIEEAEKAATMLRRFGDREWHAVPSHTTDNVWVVEEDGTTKEYGAILCSWDDVAEFLLARPYPGEVGTYMAIEAVNVDELE